MAPTFKALVRFGLLIILIQPESYLLVNDPELEIEGYPHNFINQNNMIEKVKVEELGEILKKHVQKLRNSENKQVELVFLVDSSASVGAENFFNELKFVKKLLADFTVAIYATRVSVITFSSRNRIVTQIDHLTNPSASNHKCSLLEEELPRIKYIGGGTYTLGAILEAQRVLISARKEAQKAVFLITDGFSNGGDPRLAAKVLRDNGVEVFTFGIRNGNVRELYDMASEPQKEHSYILDSFEEFEALARRALHEDLHIGTYLPQKSFKCNSLCTGGNCCDLQAICTCGTHTGHYACICEKGFYGTGLQGDCKPCPPGSYKNDTILGDVSSCVRCPDSNHDSPEGSVNEEQCFCKEGFIKTQQGLCTVLTCPKLFPPKNGYFVQNVCNNVFNAACGIRCHPGYDLIGSSIRLCNQSGLWSGKEAFCKIKTCPALKAPKNGIILCTKDDFSFESECHFTCDSGYVLVGSMKRSCLAVAYWDGLPTLCREITCPPLPELEFGKILPHSCVEGKSNYSAVCDMTCDDGFELKGPMKYQCVDPGIWSSEYESSYCIDVKPPNLTCPEDIEVVADENENSAEVLWHPPEPTDNSNDIPSLTVVPAIIPPRTFQIGKATITYLAEDKYKNKAICKFTIFVKDTQPPTVDKCISPSTILSSEQQVEVTWEEPIFHDNSGGKVYVKKSHSPGLFSLGEIKVLYEVFDESGNNNTCIITIKIQEHACGTPENPINGFSNCTNEENGIYCTLHCMEGYGFAILPAPHYFCNYSDGIWIPINQMPFPDCSVKELSNHLIIKTTTIVKTPVSCKDNFYLSQVQNHVQRTLQNKVGEECNDDFVCNVVDVVAYCEEAKLSASEELTNVLSRKRRHIQPSRITPKQVLRAYFRDLSNRRISTTASPKDEANDFNVFFIQQHNNNEYDSEFEVVPLPPVTTSKSSSDLPQTLSSANERIELDFNIRGSLHSDESHVTEQMQKTLLDNMQTLMDHLHTSAVNRELELQIGNQPLSVDNIYFDENHPNFVCIPGKVLQNNTCVNCPVGTFYNVIAEVCQPCVQGTYQTEEAQLTCFVCPERTSTQKNNSKSLVSCKAQCLPGSYSIDGLEICETCGIGFYQTDYAQTSCIPCPGNTVTYRRGTRKIQECKDVCLPGQVSRTGLIPCFNCPRGYFQPENSKSSCFRCPGSALTKTTGSSSLTECEDYTILFDPSVRPEILLINDCFSVPCLNNAHCHALEVGFICNCAPGYTGILCETELNECDSDPCINGATCVDKLNSFLCECPPGYEGETCEINTDECISSPCNNGGVCLDSINQFTCACAHGYTGIYCEKEINECDSNPCQNGGMCSDLVADYSCYCVSGYTGRNCETDIDDCASSPCKNGGTCEDMVSDFSCTCAPGFTDKFCEINIDDCLSFPCQNNATCVDQVNSFFCLCKPSFTGINCESELLSNFTAYFEKSGTMDHIYMEALKNMTEVTVCFWMKTEDKINYGTPFSYATGYSDNALTLMDYNGFVLNVNGHKKVTDVTANDGKWHHICITWSSLDGAWKIFKDSFLADNGSNLGTGSTILGNGVLILGQEQDSRGGGFSAAESFIGCITLFNIWDKLLTDKEVLHLHRSCDYKGNVKAWPDFLAGIKGRVKIEESPFCQTCPLENLQYGQTEVKEGKVFVQTFYSCDKGFRLRGDSVRYCMTYGEWTGTLPRCERVNCGYPGIILNGYISGTIYTFNNSISYNCNPGYMLEGNKLRTCTDTGNWDGDSPLCTEIKCKTNGKILNAVLFPFKDHYFPQEKLRIDCMKGYQLNGVNELLCQLDGTWDKAFPKCEPIMCKEPPKIKNGKLIEKYSELIMGTAVYYVCDKGYKIKESNSLKCGQQQIWEGMIPSCELVMCNPPPYVENSLVTGKDYSYSQVVFYQCREGYELIGEHVLKCTEEEIWDKDPPFCEPVKCGSLRAIDNGDLEVLDYSFHNFAHYSCHDGYVLVGKNVRKCLADGSWSDATPICQLGTCEKPLTINNGFYEGDNWNVGQSLIYKCNVGYHLIGFAENFCQENLTWLNDFPVCEIIICNKPENIPNGFYFGDDLYYGQSVTYECEEGFELLGESVRYCSENKTWSEGLPKCKIISCPKPKEISNGQVIANAYTYQSISHYSCNNGFEIIGKNERICEANKTWSGNLPQCIKIKCNEPDNIDHGFIEIQGLTFGDSIQYECDEGFVLQGPVIRFCEEDSSWSEFNSVCIPVNCSTPHNIENGFYFGNNFSFESVINYSCNPGYKLHGTLNIKCQSNGLWSEKPPTCVPLSCFPPNKFENGKIIGNSYTVGKIIEYVCDNGYELLGNKHLKCLTDLQWDKQPPLCQKVECIPLRNIKYGKLSEKRGKFGDIIRYSCNQGYKLEGFSERKCLSNRSWSHSDPVCKEIYCDKPSEIKNGMVLFTSLKYSQSIEYICSEGYKIEGVSRRNCNESGLWSYLEPICQIVSCPELPNLTNGHVVINNNLYLGTANFTCSLGYEIFENYSSITCQSDGYWSNPVPYCAIIKCEPLPKLLHGHISNTNYTFNNSISFLCDIGYKLIGESFITCLANHHWNSNMPVCSKIKCQPPEHIAHSFISANDISFGAIIEYSCEIGYKLIGEHKRQCLENNSWSGVSPVCEIVKCGLPEGFQNGKIIGHDFFYGSKIKYLCDIGYEISGISKRICNAHGFWSGEPPNCQIIECHFPDKISHGNIIGNNFQYGNIIHFICDDNYELQGSNLLNCTENKTWSGNFPKCKIVTCPSPQSISNGHIIWKSLNIYSQILYECDIGFELKGNSIRECLANKSWSNSIPNCQLIHCAKPKKINNGIITGENYTYSSLIKYTCSKGYELIGQNTRQCNLNSQWSGREPVCQIVSCTAPEIINNGNLTLESLSYIYGSEVHYVCDEGYNLIGEFKLQCLDNKSWSSNPPKCVIISCPPLSSIKNGKISSNNNTFNSVVYYGCNEGFDLLGYSTRICLANKTWSNSAPFCKKKQCAVPKSIDNGRSVGNKYSVGDSISYFCNIGYKLKGSAILTCLKSGNWSDNEPYCKLVSCPILKDVLNGQIINKGNNYGEVVEYICDFGYELFGKDARICQEDGSWTEETPTCEIIECPEPSNILHGHVIGKSFTFLDNIQYVCDRGYDLIGVDHRICQENKTWSNTNPVCVRVACLPITSFPNGEVTVGELFYAEKISFMCSEGFELIGHTSAICQEDGTWSAPVPECRLIACKKPEPIANGLVKGKSFEIGKEIEYSCKSGFVIKGSKKRKCKKEGKWNGSLPKCEPVICSDPPEIENGISAGEERNYGSIVFYKCDDGYELNGPNIIKCEDNSQWIGQIPSCIKISCGPPPVIPHASVLVTHYDTSSFAEYHCNQGYRLVGEAFMSCMINGTWSHEEVHCLPVLCGHPPLISNGFITASNYSYQGIVQYFCLKGHIISGKSTIRCTADGEWDGPAPVCHSIECPHPIIPENGLLEGSDFTYQNAVIISCQKGFVLVGSSVHFCQLDGTWSGTSSVCERVMCYPLSEEKAMSIEGDGHSYGDSVVFRCAPGYKLIGNHTTTCLKDGQWSSLPPSCEVITCSPPIVPIHAKNKLLSEPFSYGDRISFDCREGYRQTIDMTVICQEDGTWSEPRGGCQRVSCGVPLINKGTTLLGSSFLYGDRVPYTCPPGTQASRPQVLSCKDDGKWDHEPSCEVICQQNCLNGGRCLTPNVCKCLSGYTGDRCQHAQCNPPCKNNGRCIQPNVCYCPYGFKRPYCDREYPLQSRRKVNILKP